MLQKPRPISEPIITSWPRIMSTQAEMKRRTSHTATRPSTPEKERPAAVRPR